MTLDELVPKFCFVLLTHDKPEPGSEPKNRVPVVFCLPTVIENYDKIPTDLGEKEKIIKDYIENITKCAEAQ